MKGSVRRRGMPFRSTATPGKRVDWRATSRAFVVLSVVLLVLGGTIAYSVVRRGLSVHTEPSAAEELIARAMRRWATPASTRDLSNPVPPTSEVLEQALSHYADHCAMCHANNGGGDTAIGRNLYPRVPDMRGLTTQSLTDGELFSIIEHGVRLTGMPGWGNGTPEGERESWGLVHFIRRLDRLTEEDIERMDALNPKTSDQWREDEEARRFLSGEGATPAASHKHGGKQ